MPVFRLFTSACPTHSDPGAHRIQHPSPSSSSSSSSPQSSASFSPSSSSSSPSTAPSSPRRTFRHLSPSDIHLLTRILSPSSSSSSSGGEPTLPPFSSTPPPPPPPPPPARPESPATNATVARIRTRLRIVTLPAHLRVQPASGCGKEDDDNGVRGEILCAFHNGLDAEVFRDVLAFVRREVGEWGTAGSAELMGEEGGKEEERRRIKQVLEVLRQAREEAGVFWDAAGRSWGKEVSEGEPEPEKDIGATPRSSPSRGVAPDSAASPSPPSSLTSPSTPPTQTTSDLDLGNACPACVLARVGGSPALVLALRVSLLARCRWERLAKGSKRLAWVDGWLWWACMCDATAAGLGGPEVDAIARALFDGKVKESEVVGRMLKGSLKMERRRSKREEKRKRKGGEERRNGNDEAVLPSPSSVYSQEGERVPSTNATYGTLSIQERRRGSPAYLTINVPSSSAMSPWWPTQMHLHPALRGNVCHFGERLKKHLSLVTPAETLVADYRALVTPCSDM